MSRPERCDVAVVGAGPAGAAAAITLARAGLHTVVVDRARFPRDKTCGDGITTMALRHLEHLGLDPASVPSWTPVDTLWLSSPSRRVVHLRLPSDQGAFAVVARRLELDAALVDVARRAGAKIHEGVACRGLERDANGIRLRTDSGEFEAPNVIAADGMWSPVRRFAGLAEPGYHGEWHAFRQYVTGVEGAAASDFLIWFEPDLLPGYAWSFPLGGGRANIGFGIWPGHRYSTADMKWLWPELLSRPHIAAALGPAVEPEGPHRAWPIPARTDTATLADGGLLFVGDAACLADPMTGEGIGQALHSGIRAGESIIAAHESGEGGPAAGAAYARRLRAELGPDHQMAMLLVRALQHRKGARIAIALAGATPWTRANFARWLFEDYPRGIALTPRRWRRGMLSGPGAYRDALAPAATPAVVRSGRAR